MWIYQYAFLPRALKPQAIYEFSLSTVKKSVERKIRGYMTRWFGVPRCISSVRKSNALQLSSCSLVTNRRTQIQCRDSINLKISEMGIEVRSSRKLSPAKELKVTKERLRQKTIVGAVVKGRAGLGHVSRLWIHTLKGKDVTIIIRFSQELKKKDKDARAKLTRNRDKVGGINKMENEMVRHLVHYL